MKALLYVEEGSIDPHDFGVRVEDRAYYRPILETAAQYCVKSFEEAKAEENKEEAVYFSSRLGAIRSFLGAYDPKVRDPERHFDITYAEATYVAKRRVDDHRLYCDLTKAMAAKGIFTARLTRSAITGGEYDTYIKDSCLFVPLAVGQTALTAVEGGAETPAGEHLVEAA